MGSKRINERNKDQDFDPNVNKTLKNPWVLEPLSENPWVPWNPYYTLSKIGPLTQNKYGTILWPSGIPL